MRLDPLLPPRALTPPATPVRTDTLLDRLAELATLSQHQPGRLDDGRDVRSVRLGDPVEGDDGLVRKGDGSALHRTERIEATPCFRGGVAIGRLAASPILAATKTP